MGFAFYRSSREQVIGGAGRLLYQLTAAELGSTPVFPTKISDIMNTSNFAAQVANGWRDFGQTNDGITISRAVSMTTWDTDQVTEVVEAIDRWTHTLATNLAEMSLENLQLAWEGGTITAVSGGLPGERYLPFGIPSTLTARRIAVLFRDRYGYLHAWVFREAQLNTMGETAFTRGTMQTLPCTWKLFADTAINDENDQTFRYYTDKPATTSTSTTTSTSSSTSTTTTP